MKNTDQRAEYQQSFRVIRDAQEQIREIVECQMRGAAIAMMQQLFSEEVEKLCGPKFSRKNSELCHRGGSDPGRVLLHGQQVSVKKPRVKKSGKDVELESYSALQNYDLLCNRVMNHMLNGVSTRNYEPLLDDISGGTGLKKSTVSSAFVAASKEQLEDLNGRDLSKHEFVSLMLDGVGYGDRTVVVALGITSKGKKLILGLREGNTENWEVCRDLFENLIDRGLNIEKQYLFVIDGGKALKKAIRKVFGKRSFIQRCVRHKERNIIKYLPEQRHLEFRRRWKKLHGHMSYHEAEKDYATLIEWLGHINTAALTSLEEAELDTLTVIRLKTPNLLRKTLSSTNPIESAFSIAQERTRRVKNWRSGNDQVSRWAASALLAAEKRFRTIKGFREISVLEDEMKNFSIEKQKKVA